MWFPNDLLIYQVPHKVYGRQEAP